MKTLLLLTVSLLMIASVAMADHIGVYTDVTGTSNEIHCGFTSTVAIVQKFVIGSTASRFRLDLPPGSTLYAFTTPFTSLGALGSDLSLVYGECRDGSFALGTIVANLAPGIMQIRAASGQSTIVVTDCSFTEKSATGGTAYVTGNCTVATGHATWGSIKALYR